MTRDLSKVSSAIRGWVGKSKSRIWYRTAHSYPSEATVGLALVVSGVAATPYLHSEERRLSLRSSTLRPTPRPARRAVASSWLSAFPRKAGALLCGYAAPVFHRGRPGCADRDCARRRVKSNREEKHAQREVRRPMTAAQEIAPQLETTLVLPQQSEFRSRFQIAVEFPPAMPPDQYLLPASPDRGARTAPAHAGAAARAGSDFYRAACGNMNDK